MTRFCTNCGQPIADGVRFCTNCGAPAPVEQPQPTYSYSEPEPQPVRQQPLTPKPKNHLALSILATIFCCLPFGIPAIVFAAKVDNLWNAGKYQEAEDASRKARTWMLVSIILGAVAVISYAAFVIYGMSVYGEDFLDELRQY
jgi:hypothetical protein